MNKLNVKYQNYFDRNYKLSPSLKFGYIFMKNLWNFLTGDIPINKKRFYNDYQKIFLYGYWKNKEIIPKEYFKTIEEIKEIILKRESVSEYTFIRLNKPELFIKFDLILRNLILITKRDEILSQEDFWYILNYYKQTFALNKTQYKLITHE